MFFIVPERKASSQPPSPAVDESTTLSPPTKRQRLSPETDETAGYYPKRTPKACDRCRLKKARCQWNNGKICDKCKRDGVICTATRESKREPKPPNAAYVQLVESQRDCLLHAVSKIFEDGSSKDPAAMVKMLQDSGIRVDDLKKAPRRNQTDKPTHIDEIKTYKDPAWIQALASTTAAKMNTSAAESPPNTSIPQSYFDQPPHADIQTDASQTLSSVAGEASSIFDASFLPSTEIDDWLVFDESGDDWSLPFTDSRLGGVTT